MPWCFVRLLTRPVPQYLSLPSIPDDFPHNIARLTDEANGPVVLKEF